MIFNLCRLMRTAVVQMVCMIPMVEAARKMAKEASQAPSGSSSPASPPPPWQRWRGWPGTWGLKLCLVNQPQGAPPTWLCPSWAGPSSFSVPSPASVMSSHPSGFRTVTKIKSLKVGNEVRWKKSIRNFLEASLLKI